MERIYLSLRFVSFLFPFGGLFLQELLRRFVLFIRGFDLRDYCDEDVNRLKPDIFSVKLNKATKSDGKNEIFFIRFKNINNTDHNNNNGKNEMINVFRGV